MINTVIIEDEKPALEHLANTLTAVAADVRVKAHLTTVAESIKYLSHDTEIDLIFSDVRLGDGLSFEIFTRPGFRMPVIFITAYDEFILHAFDHNGIDYLLKPVEMESLDRALNKYRMLEKHFTDHHAITRLLQYMDRNKKKRIIVKKGSENISLKLEDVVLFYTENKLLYAVDRWGKKYFADTTLGELEGTLDKNVFFRANRQYIVNINFIQGFKTIEKVKLLVELTLPGSNHLIIISQETAPHFRHWINNV